MEYIIFQDYNVLSYDSIHTLSPDNNLLAHCRRPFRFLTMSFPLRVTEWQWQNVQTHIMTILAAAIVARWKMFASIIVFVGHYTVFLAWISSDFSDICVCAWKMSRKKWSSLVFRYSNLICFVGWQRAWLLQYFYAALAWILGLLHLAGVGIVRLSPQRIYPPPWSPSRGAAGGQNCCSGFPPRYRKWLPPVTS